MNLYYDVHFAPPLSRVEKAILIEKINLAWRRKVYDDQFMLETKDLSLQNRQRGPKPARWRSGSSWKNQSLLSRHEKKGKTAKGMKRIMQYHPEAGFGFDFGAKMASSIAGLGSGIASAVASVDRAQWEAHEHADVTNNAFFEERRQHPDREPSLMEMLRNGHDGLTAICRAVDQFRQLADSFIEAVAYTQPAREQHFMITLVSRLEDIIALYLVISRSSNLVTVMGGIHLYLRTVFPYGSRAMQIGQYIAKIMEATNVDTIPHDFEYSGSSERYKAEGFSFDDMGDLTSEFESWFKEAGDFWTNLPRLKNSQFRTKFIKIFDTLIALGLIPETDGEFPLRIANIEFMRRKQTVEKGTWNFIEHIVDSCQFIAERAIFLVRTGDLYAALLGEDELNDFDREFSIISAAAKVAHDEEVLTQYKVNGVQQFKDRAEYTRRLVALIAVSEDFLKAKKLHPNLLSAIRSKNVVLRSYEVEDMQRNLSRPMIERPYSVNIFGGSSVGKSTVNSLVIRAILEAGGYKSDPDYLVNLKAGMKFDDATQPHHNGATFDDYCNSRAEFMDSPPTQMIIDIINNARAQINRANANEKGKYYYNFKAVTITTNQKDLHANKFSVCPESILRRLNCTLTVKLKREAIGYDGGINPSVFLSPQGTQLMMPDAWNIDIERAIINRSGLKDTVSYEMVKENASIGEVLEYITADAKKFYASQKKYVSSMLKFNTVELCEHGCPATECPQCKATYLAKGFLYAAVKAHRVSQKDMAPAFAHIRESIKNDPSFMINNYPEEYYIPRDYLLDNECSFLKSYTLPDDIAKELVDVAEGIDEDEFSDTVEGDEFGLPRADYNGEAGLDDMLPAWRKHLNIDPEVVCKPLSEWWQDERKFRATLIGISMATLAGMGTIFLAAKFLVSNVMTYEAEMAVSKPNPTEFDKTYDHEQEKKWKEVEFKPIETQEACKTTTLADMINVVHKNLAVVEYSTESGGKVIAHSNAFPVCGNYWLLPYHVLVDGVKLYVRLSRNDRRVTSCVAKGTITPKASVKIPGKDLILVQITGSLNPNMTKFFPQTNKMGIHSKVYKNCASFQCESELVNLDKVEKASFNGREYVTNWTHKIGTIVGKSRCMSALIHEESSSISGFHVGSNAKHGVCHVAMVTLSEIKDALKKIETNTYTEMRPHDAVPFTPEAALYGKKYFGTGEIPDSNPVRFADADASFEVLGVGQPKRTFKSVIVPSKICTATEEVYNTPRTHGKPFRMNSYIHWQRDMDKFTHPSGDFEEEAWRKAKLDLQVSFLQSGRKIGWGKDGEDNLKYQVFDEETVVNGADGVAMVDKIPMKTSAGQPINKCKKDIWIEDPERVGKYMLDDETRRKCQENERAFLRGERINTNFRMHLKDEPKGVGVEKVRLMAGAEANFTCTVRKYTLSAVRAIQMHWTEFECAVGINVYSKQWSELYNYLSEYGVDNAIAGDYSGFDKRVTPKALTAAWEIFHEFCRAGGADEDALKIIRGISTETSYPTYEFNGVILQAYGSMPSGHPLTVIINNIQNSLYMRYAYYKLAAEHTRIYPNNFRSHVRLMCYGDDNIMTVRGCPWFNQVNISAALDKAGIVYTDEAKTGLADRYKNLSELSFLKRSFRWSDDCKEWMAPIEEASILKTLFCRHSDSPETDTKLAVDALDKAANTEWFLHGEEAHAKHLVKLRAIAVKAGIDNLINFKRYAELVFEYHQKYHDQKTADRWWESDFRPIRVDNLDERLTIIEECPSDENDMDYSPEVGLVGDDDDELSITTGVPVDPIYNRRRAISFAPDYSHNWYGYEYPEELAEEDFRSCHHSSRPLEAREVEQVTVASNDGHVSNKNLKGMWNALRQMVRSIRMRLATARFSPQHSLASECKEE